MALMRNLSWLALGEGVGRLVGLGVVLYLARVVGAQNFGLLGSASALVTYFAIFAAGGGDYKGVRGIARNPGDIATVLWVNTAAHLVCLAAAYAVLGACLAFTSIAPQGAVALVLVYSLMMVTSALDPAWALRGIENMRAVATGEILQQLLFALLLVVLVRDASTPLTVIAGAQVFSEFVQVGFNYVVLGRRVRRPANPLDWRRVLATVREALGIAVGRIPRMLYLFGDVLLLAWLATAAAAGEFLASHRLVLTFVVVGSLVRLGIFPRVSQLALVSPPRAGGMQMDALRNEWLLFAPAWVCCWIYAEPLVALLYGPGYPQTAGILRWMLLTVPVFGLSLALQDLLAVVRRDRTYIGANALAMLVHLALAYALIGTRGASGAAVAALTAELLGAALLFAWRDRDVLPARLVGKPLRVLGAAAAMLAVMYVLAALPMWVVVPAGAAAFAATALAAGAVSLRELGEMIAWLRALASPVRQAP